MKKVITFGEIMLRLSPENYLRITQTEKFQATYAGAEANVAVSLANFGIPSSFVSRLPNNEVGQSAINSLRKFGVDTSNVVLGGERVGIYFCEKGASQRASKVIYDRQYSSIATASMEDFDWCKIFDGANWLHITGITPALSDSMSQISILAVKKAKEMGLTVSCDLNYRKKLWSKDKASQAMTEICKYVDYLIANEEDAKDVFGIEASGTDISTGKINKDGYVSVAKMLSDKFDLKGVAITLRESLSASDNNWSGMFYSKGNAFFSRKYAVHIVDRVGAGDSFGAGIIYSILVGKSCQEIIEFAVASSCLKHSIEGDFNLVSLEEVENLVGGNASGRVQR